MGIITKRNGLLRLGITITIISFLVMMFFPDLLFTKIGEEYVYTPLANIVYSCFFLGPILTVIGIPVYIIASKRKPSKLMNILKSSADMRTKISFLSKHLRTDEKDVVHTVSKLRSNGVPILIDDSTLEVVYNPALSPPSTEIRKPALTLHEKLEVILSILAILVTVIVALLK